MAGKSKVNTKFVIALVGVLVLAAVGVGGVVLYVTGRSAESLMTKGEGLVKQNDWEGAERLFAMAVNKEQTNLDYLRRWGDALRQITPAAQVEYEQKYFLEYRSGMLRQVALLEDLNPEAYHAFLGQVYADLQVAGATRTDIQNFIASELDGAIKRFTDAADQGRELPKNWETLRRYRGILRARLLVEPEDAQTPAELAQAKEDLQAALRANPADDEAVSALQEYYAVLTERRRRDNLLDEANAMRAESRAMLEQFVAANPTSPGGMMAKLSFDLTERRQEELVRTGGEAIANWSDLARDFKPRVDEIALLIERAGAAKVPQTILTRMQNIEALLDPDAKFARTKKLLEARLAADPGDHLSLVQLGTMLGDAGDRQAAIETLDKVVAMPVPPLSFRGCLLYVRKPAAAAMQARYALQSWDLTKDANEKTALLTKAKAFRAKAGELSTGESPVLKFLDAQLAFADEDRKTAKRLLGEYLREVNDGDPEALLILARLNMADNETGEAERRLEQLAQRGRLSPPLGGLLIQVKMMLRKTDEAKAIADDLARRFPGDPEVQRIVGLVAGQSDDPLVKGLLEAQKLVEEGKDAEATDLLVKLSRDSQYNLQALQFAVMRLANAGKNAEALALLKEARTVHTDNKGVEAMIVSLETTDPYAARMAVIPLLDVPEVEKIIARYNAAKEFNKPEEATKHLKELEALNTEEVRALEIMFVDAVDRKDLARATQITELVTRKNLDKLQGRSYRARLLFAEGKTNEAVLMLEQATSEEATPLEMHRLLARLQERAGRAGEAAAAYRRALAIRPTDAGTTVEFLSLLVRENRAQEALDEGRAREKFVRGDTRFAELMLQLEAQLGDKERALVAAERKLASTPGDLRNKLMVASLRTETRRFSEARQLIDELKALQPGVETMLLEARWHADQGELEAARQVFVSTILEMPRDKMTSAPYLAFGEFMLGRGIDAIGLTALNQARRYQNPQEMEADKVLGDRLTSMGRLSDAEQPYRRVIEGGADTPELIFRKRLIEVLVRQRKYDEADALLKAVADKKDSDVVLLLLSADIAKGKNDERAMRLAIDRAKTDYGRQAMVWLKSAQLQVDRPELRTDVLADLERAIQLEPTLWQAFRMRALMHAEVGRIDEAIEDLRSCLRLNPNQTELGRSLMDELARRQREAEAVSLGEEVARARPGDVQLLVDLGEVFVLRKQWTQAGVFYKKAYEQSKVPVVVQRYLDCLLNSTPPSLNEAEQVLRGASDKIESDLGLLMCRAQLLVRRGRDADGMRDIRSALKLASAQTLAEWSGRLDVIFPERSEQIKRLELLERDGVQRDWLAYFRAVRLLMDSGRADEGIKVLERLQASGESGPRLSAFREHGGYLYNKQDFQGAVKVFQRGAEAFPDDWSQHNNLAAILSESLNRAAEAVAPARRAFEIVDGELNRTGGLAEPNAIQVYETLGTALLGTGQGAEAVEFLRRASTLPGPSSTRLSVLIALGRCQSQAGDSEGAGKTLRQIQAVVQLTPTLATERQKELIEELRKKHGSS
ncbi:MAG: tetratricopeptide repeat protein [Planctomycetota bacterium]|nr:tetratricopeptide repeat protein [Planctomycetota bacterium]